MSGYVRLSRSGFRVESFGSRACVNAYTLKPSPCDAPLVHHGPQGSARSFEYSLLFLALPLRVLH